MQTKTRNYFKYAIGEIALVVIGILIALSINNWNEHRKNSSKESAILEDIHIEFQQNRKQLDSVVSLHIISHSNSAKIIKLFPITSKPEPNVLDSLGEHLWSSYSGYTFNPSQTSIHALASTSSFDLITDKTLRNLLISWNDLVTDYQEEELRSRNYAINQYDAYMSKHFDWNFNFADHRNNFNALQTLEFEFLVKTNYDLVDQILTTSGELRKVQEALDQIIDLSAPHSNYARQE